MEKAAEALTNYFLKANIIEDGQKEWCRYMIMHRMMNVVSLLVLVPIGAILAGWVNSLLFTLGYRFLRTRTGGYHAHTPFQCLISAVVIQVGSLFLLLPIFQHQVWLLLMLALSVIIILLLSPVDNKNIHITDEERANLTKSVHKRLFIMILAVLVSMKATQHIAADLALSVFITAFTICLSRLGLGIQ